MKVCVFTATKRYGGLDVTYSALREQTYKDFIWLVADELWEERFDVLIERASDLKVIGLRSRFKPDGYYSDLPGLYNEAIKAASLYDCELFVSLQDYIWIPDFGLERFVTAFEEYPKGIVAGLCSMSAEPGVEAVVDPAGLWSVFAEGYPGYDDEPIEWVDVRMMQYRPGTLAPATPVSWEMNWAMCPTSVGPLFDERYGKHIGNENAQFAWACRQAGYEVYVDALNHAISLPHRHYFPDEWDEQQGHREINMAQYRADFVEMEEQEWLGQGGNI